VLFALVGGASALVEFGVFVALDALGMVAWAASAISFVSSFFVNYRGNRDLTFRAGAVPGAIRRYMVLVAVNLVASTALVAALTWFDVRGWIAKLIAMALVGLVNFVVLRVWVFRPGR
jgi:putative flippase GtrA